MGTLPSGQSETRSTNYAGGQANEPQQDGGKAGATKNKAWRATAERVTHPATTLQSILAPLRWESRLRNLVESEHVPH
jgi:hypothetical protein